MAEERRGVSYPLWERVDKARRARGWSWAELSRRSGVRRPTISALATNSTAPHPHNVNRLAQALGIDQAEAHLLSQGGPTAGDDEQSSSRAQIFQLRGLNSRQKALLANVYDEMVRSNRDDAEQAQPELRVVDGDN